MIHNLLLKRASSKKNAAQRFLWIGLLFWVFSLSAQSTPTQKLVVNASHIIHDGKTILRWIPGNYETWKWGNEYGYVVERYTIERNGVKLNTEEEYSSLLVIEDPLKILSEGDFEAAADNTPMMGVAGAALYSTEFDVTTGSQDPSWVTARNQVQEKESRYGFSLYKKQSAHLSCKICIGRYTNLKPNEMHGQEIQI